MTTVARLKNTEELLLVDEVNERLPVIQDGLYAHFPFDGKGGVVDPINGITPTDPLYTGIDLITPVGGYANDPANWSRGRAGSGSLTYDSTEDSLLHDASSYSYWEFNGYIKVQPGRTYHMTCTGKSEGADGDDDLYCGITQQDGNKAYIGSNDGHRYFVVANTNPPTNWKVYQGTYIPESGVEYVRPMFLTNHTVTTRNKMWVKDIRLWVEESDGSNTLIFDSGLAVNNSTTNLKSGGECDGSSSLGITTYGENYESCYHEFIKAAAGRKDVLHVQYDRTKNDRTLDFIIRESGIANTQVGEEYCLAYDYRVNSGTDIPNGAILYQDGWKNDGTATREFLYEIDLENGWKRRCYRFTITTAGGAYLRFSSGYKNNSYDWYYDNIQFEKGGFPTAFVPNSHSKGSVRFDFPTVGSDYTVVGKFTPHTPFSNADAYTYTTNQSALFCVTDEANGGSYFFRYWHNDSSSAPFIDCNGYYTTSHIHKAYEIEAGVPLYWVLRKEGDKLELELYQNGWKGSHNHSVPVDARLDTLRFGNDDLWDGIHHYVSVYDRALTDSEKVSIPEKSVSMRDTGTLITPTLDEHYKWKMIFHGLVTQLSYESYDFMERLNLNGDDLIFDEMMIYCPYWDYKVTAQTTEKAKLKYSIKWYMEWLFAQSDGSSPRMKFHGLDDVQDVGFVQETNMFWGYGNSWRKTTPVHYTTGSYDYMYLGAVPSYIHKDDWGNYYGDTDNYVHYMNNNDFREGGTYQITPREFQTIQIFVRELPTNEIPMRMKNSSVLVGDQIQEGATL